MGLVLCVGVVAKTGSRPCVVWPPSMAASYFLLLAQKKVTKEKGTLGFAPSPKARVRCGRTGSAHRASMACCRNRRDPSRRPRAVHAAFPSTLRRCSEGKSKGKTDVSDISDASAFLRQGLPRSALPGPLSAAARTRRKSREAVAGRMPATSTRAHGCAPGEALRVLAKFAGHGCPANRVREGALFLGY